MRIVRAAALAVTGLAALGAPRAPARIALSTHHAIPPALLVLQSALAPDDIVACLAKRAVPPSVVPAEVGKRVLLGRGDGWVDLLPAANGTQLRARILWESPAMTELWLRACASGKPPHRGSIVAAIAKPWPGKVTHPG